MFVMKLKTCSLNNVKIRWNNYFWQKYTTQKALFVEWYYKELQVITSRLYMHTFSTASSVSLPVKINICAFYRPRLLSGISCCILLFILSHLLAYPSVHYRGSAFFRYHKCAARVATQPLSPTLYSCCHHHSRQTTYTIQPSNNHLMTRSQTSDLGCIDAFD